MDDVEFKLKRAKISLSKEFPFFSDILFFMEMTPVESVQTMGIDYKGHVYYNPKFVAGLNMKQLKGVLIHESIHPAWLHILRGSKKQNKGVWNLAVDCQDNMMVIKQGLQLPEDCGCVPNAYRDSVTVKQGAWSYEVENVMTKPAESIYEELMSKIPKSLAKQLEKGVGASGGVDEHMYPQPGDHISDEELQRAEDEWKQRAINAAERARQAGKLPAGMERFFGEILEPQVDWRTVMYQFITGGLPCDRTWIRRDRRYAAHGFYIPDQKRESTDIFAWVDTSGSIADKEISQFKTELIGAKRAFESLKLSLGFCDDKVYEPVLEFDQVEESDIMKAKPRGGGGTDMRKCIKYVVDKHPETEVVVILTDGYTPFPTRAEVPNNMRILWIICPGGITKEHIANDNIAGDFVFMKRE